MARPTKPKGSTKDAHISTRFSADLKSRLEAAAQKSGVKLSEEISQRLEASFRDRSGNGSGETPAILDLFELVLKNIWTRTGHHWHEHAYSHRLAMEALPAVLEHFRPPGRAVVPTDHPALVRAAYLNRERPSWMKRRVNLKDLKVHLQQMDGGAEFGLLALAVMEMAPGTRMPQEAGAEAIESMDYYKSLAKVLAPKLIRLKRSNVAGEKIVEHLKSENSRKKPHGSK